MRYVAAGGYVRAIGRGRVRPGLTRPSLGTTRYRVYRTFRGRKGAGGSLECSWHQGQRDASVGTSTFPVLIRARTKPLRENEVAVVWSDQGSGMHGERPVCHRVDHYPGVVRGSHGSKARGGVLCKPYTTSTQAYHGIPIPRLEHQGSKDTDHIKPGHFPSAVGALIIEK